MSKKGQSSRHNGVIKRNVSTVWTGCISFVGAAALGADKTKAKVGYLEHSIEKKC